ncbi:MULTISPECIES: polysaccharide deacetylase family protein [unclassified Streptomyces]|uniref:polysaccharide deacetylase family protein n=1 Tax=unclassified Streptomyces TaxID=2593676 RepID=UPI00224D04D2|nr:MULTISPECIES: polysaccharide deacetylase family protein [unclassified Streptomyces]MCX4527797.1 polysaccharide deacetylase family protein [Streptomyces sp. NBC_01551]MCX4541606.1 polysaccharide deacetylase family protein [Streptomyces sp. NBC_01565]
MGFKERIRSQGVRARIAVAASAAAVAATVWGVVALVDPGQQSLQDNASRQAQHPTPDGKDGKGGKDGKDGQGGGDAAGGGPRVPETIAHASESGGNAVNITIDDGPDPRWTPQILDILKRHDVKATFCMVGPQAKAHPDLVKKVVEGGHRLCDHTMDHDTSMDKKPVAYQEQQILEAKKLIEEAAGGAKVEYYRAPGGAFTPDSRRIAAANGMRPLGWNVDTKDFQKPGVAAIVNSVKREIGNGPTVLFHDGGGNRTQSVEALDQVLAWLKDQGRPTGFPVRTVDDNPGPPAS